MFLSFKFLLWKHGHPQSFSSSTKMSRIFVFKFLALSTRNIRKKSVWLVLDRPIKIVLHTPILPDWADLLGEIFTGQKIPELSLLLCIKKTTRASEQHTYSVQHTSASTRLPCSRVGSRLPGRGEGVGGAPLSRALMARTAHP